MDMKRRLEDFVVPLWHGEGVWGELAADLGAVSSVVEEACALR